ncbi:MAG: hypothetical protein PVJ83_04970 [Gammaproteobacteria bacterium]|jgi:hypothetical protein
MDEPYPESVKHREIGFRDPHPDPHQAKTALVLLADVEGIVHASIPDPTRNSIRVSYDLSRVCLRIVEALLTELGFHLDNSLMSRFKRALYYYTEENEMQSLSVHDTQDYSTREIFMRCYRCKMHGCRDERPEHWRNYL